MTMHTDRYSVKNFLRAVFSGRPPPEDPFARSDWIGVAFDRNRYEQLAPLEWWGALVRCSSVFLMEEEIIFVEKDALSLLDDSGVHAISNAKESVFNYFDQNDNFLRDQCLVGKSLNWACLLDQDVSLFGGEKEFMQKCFNEVGGRAYLRAKMRSDFIGDNVSLSDCSDDFAEKFESYFDRLLGVHVINKDTHNS